MREAYQELLADRGRVADALAKGGEAARAVASGKMERVRRAIGVA